MNDGDDYYYCIISFFNIMFVGLQMLYAPVYVYVCVQFDSNLLFSCYQWIYIAVCVFVSLSLCLGMCVAVELVRQHWMLSIQF